MKPNKKTIRKHKENPIKNSFQPAKTPVGKGILRERKKANETPMSKAIECKNANC